MPLKKAALKKENGLLKAHFVTKVELNWYT